MYPYSPYQGQYQQTGFIHVQSEDEARMYRVAPGGSVTFINDNAPYCYTKTAGFSQFDAPIFRKFRLVEEPLTDAQNSPSQPQQAQAPDYAPNTFEGQIKALSVRIEALEAKISKEDVNEPIKCTTKHNANAPTGKS